MLIGSKNQLNHSEHSIAFMLRCSIAVASIELPKESINASSDSSNAKGCVNIAHGDNFFLDLTGLEKIRLLL